jgi:translation initiation factor 2 alpha subunit (eIF-2alpha)
MGVEEVKLDQIIAEQQQQETEDAIEDAIEEVKEELEEQLEEVVEALEEVVERPPDVIVQDFTTEVDYERLSDMVADKIMARSAPVEGEPEPEPEPEQEHTEPPEDEPPNSSSFLYKKRT